MRTLLLVGAGHAHLHIIRAWLREPIPNWQLVVLSSSPYQYYSGMFSGFAEGIYEEAETRISLVPFCRIAKAVFYEETVVKIDAKEKVVYGKTGESYAYELVSFDIGSRIAIPDGFQTHSPTVKPAHKMMEAVQTFRETQHPVVVGGGAAASEMALSIQQWRLANKFVEPVTIISHSKFMADVYEEFKAAGIVYKDQDSPLSVENYVVTTENGLKLACSQLLWLTGASSFPLFQDSGLATEDGFLKVIPTLQALDEPTIFAVGDCAHFGEGLAKNGVHAVKQGPVLWYNLQAIILNQKLRAYEPKKNQLSILSLGNRRGLAIYGDRTLKGRFAWKLKNRIDQNFMKKYR
ncbi:FAD-dependent oxidoreductase [Chryseomicrobium sp. FSL W7-1435]|uniref:FAD-dependent oxidoreductase n=1 Tax=Chryseomicrobium sp. FSL W7-1435 TaxID=2921704 RepID=UPI003159F765